MSKALKFLLLPTLTIVAFLFACNKSDDLTVDEALDQVLYSVQERGGMGRYGCYELVFPVSITLPNGTTTEVDSYEAIKQQLRIYFEANGERRRPRGGMYQHLSFVYPISVVSQDGEVITVEDETAMMELRAQCSGTFRNHDSRGHGQHGLSCFEVVFPVTIELPDGTTVQVDNRQAIHQTLRTWHQNNPGVPARAKLVFPITVKMAADGTLVTINSRDELRALKAGCQ